jgi:hypothetical protein
MAASEGDVGGLVVVLQSDEGETPAMTSDRATMVATMMASSQMAQDIDRVMAECRKRVWSDHCGCVYAPSPC